MKFPHSTKIKMVMTRKIMTIKVETGTRSGPCNQIQEMVIRLPSSLSDFSAASSAFDQGVTFISSSPESHIPNLRKVSLELFPDT